MRRSVLIFWLTVTILASLAYAAVQGDFIINGVDATTTTKFYRIRASQLYGLLVDVSRVTGTVNVLVTNTSVTVNGTVAISTMPSVTISSMPSVTISSLPTGTVNNRTGDFLVTTNSSVALLNSGVTFTGTFTETIGYANITVMVLSNVASATNGVKIQYSSDGTNIDYVSTREYTDNIGNGVVYTVPTRGRYVRVLYTNGGTNQATFRLQSFLRVSPSSAAIQEVDTVVGNHVQALVTKSVVMGKTTAGGGSYVDVKVNPSGALTVDATQATIPWVTSTYMQAVAEGSIAGTLAVNKFGAAPNGVQTGLTDIWDRADATPTQQIWLAPTAARQHSIVSTSTDDDGSPEGIGTRTLKLWGLQTWSTPESSETVTMNGTTPVLTANSYVIIHRMKSLTTGTGGNVGVITATAAAPDSTVTAVILIGNLQTEMAIYGVNTGSVAYIYRWGANIDRASGAAVTADFRLSVNERPDVQPTVFWRKDDIALQSTGTNQFDRIYQVPYKISGPAIIKIQGIGSTSDIDAESGFDLIVK